MFACVGSLQVLQHLSKDMHLKDRGRKHSVGVNVSLNGLLSMMALEKRKEYICFLIHFNYEQYSALSASTASTVILGRSWKTSQPKWHLFLLIFLLSFKLLKTGFMKSRKYNIPCSAQVDD